MKQRSGNKTLSIRTNYTTIADGTDTSLESIVVLEEGSFSSNAFDIVASASISGNVIFGGDTTVVESCNDAVFQIIRPTSTLQDTLDITVDTLTGTATGGKLRVWAMVMDVDGKGAEEVDRDYLA